MHAINSIEYLYQMKGFRHGVGRQPIDPDFEDSKEYNKGYSDGQIAARKYSDDLCVKLRLENPLIEQ